jgi:uncharacterized RDD family membrane protein YckC
MSAYPKRVPVLKTQVPPHSAKPKPRLYVARHIQEDLTQYEAASLWTRFAAAVLDSVFMGIATQAVSLIVELSLRAESFMGFTLSLLAYFIVPVAYYVVSMNQFPGQSPGKRLLKIRVVSMVENEEFSGWRRIVKREFWGKFCSSFLFGVGYLLPFLRKDRRALHDLIAKSRVIRFN